MQNLFAALILVLAATLGVVVRKENQMLRRNLQI